MSDAPEDQAAKPRRIQIGTQRPGVKPPSLGPKYRYVGPAASAPPDAALAASEPAAAPEAATMGDSPAAGDAPVEATPAQGQPRDHTGSGGPGTGPRGGRGKRRDGVKMPSPADVLPPSKRVAVPNLRAGLDEDLEADFEAALGDLAIDDLLEAQAAIKAEAPLDPGTRITGVVLSIGADTAFIDLGGRRQGAMKLAGFLDRGEDLPEPGQPIEVSVGGRNDADGLYDVAPGNRAVAVEDWTQLEAGMVVEARVTAANKGGLECEVAGLRGFMPASLVSTWRVENLEELVGQTLESLVTEIVPAARRLVLSRRAVIEKQAAEAKVKMLETLEPGVELEGIVRSVRDFGAFVDIGNGVEGLVHVSELSWERVANPADVLQQGQKVRVIVKKIDPQTGKIGLSARDLIESPWKRAADKYHVGATIRGTVSRIAQFGAFVKLEPGVEGLVHISELATRRIRSVADVVKEGEQVECRVLAIDPHEQKLALSIKALAPPPAARHAAGEPEPEVEAAEPEAPPPPRKQRTTPLKGGVGGESDGARFGLKW
ncbi:MAG: S1 RNA-binding domain-containing protein [Planctomycetia bacterium]|nr:S1 RNA-binding domain-containing protein [Planctomycetia bacterium]